MGIKGFFHINKTLAFSHVCGYCSGSGFASFLQQPFLHEAVRFCFVFFYGSPRENLTCVDFTVVEIVSYKLLGLLFPHDFN